MINLQGAKLRAIEIIETISKNTYIYADIDEQIGLIEAGSPNSYPKPVSNSTKRNKEEMARASCSPSIDEAHWRMLDPSTGCMNSLCA